MRIAVVSNTSWYLYNFRLNLIHALQAAGHDVVAVAPAADHAEKIRSAGVRFESVAISGGGTNPLTELKSVAALFDVFRRHRIELVLSYTPKGNLYSALACIASGRTFVPNVSGLGRAFIRRSLVTQIARVLYRTTFRRAHRVFFQNNDDQAFFITEGFVTRDQALRVPGSGVDLERFSPTAVGVTNVTRVDSAPVFLMIARLMWDKGVGEYVKAAASVRKHYPDARFQVLGFLDVDNPSAVPRASVEQWVAEGTIEYLGPTDDVRPFMRDADCVVLPSYREGMPRTMLEAAAMGRPIITTDTNGCRDTVIDGETGYLCRVQDGPDLAAKMHQFIALPINKREAMGMRGRAYVEREFDERVVLERYAEVVELLSR